jgi:hypothetical protein
MMADLLRMGTIGDKTSTGPTWKLPRQQMLGPFFIIFDRSNVIGDGLSLPKMMLGDASDNRT